MSAFNCGKGGEIAGRVRAGTLGAPRAETGAERAAGPAVTPFPLKSLIFAIAVSATVLRGQDYTTDKPAPNPAITVPLTPEQKNALEAVDVRIAGVEALVAKIDDPAYRENCVAAVKDLKKRRGSLEKNFDPALYESLMHSVISRYQVIALWLTPPRVAPRAENAGAATGKTGK